MQTRDTPREGGQRRPPGGCEARVKVYERKADAHRGYRKAHKGRDAPDYYTFENSLAGLVKLARWLFRKKIRPRPVDGALERIVVEFNHRREPDR